jgi:hypothetical protein
MVTQGAVTGKSYHSFLAAFCSKQQIFLCGKPEFWLKMLKMMSISSRPYSCSCYKPSLFIRYHRCSLNIKNNSEFSERMFFPQTLSCLTSYIFSSTLVSLLQQILLYWTPRRKSVHWLTKRSSHWCGLLSLFYEPQKWSVTHLSVFSLFHLS